ncbi:MAG TPA: Gmad2 immunoglobulin-like domain-containing protein [Bacilli bacterium]
MKKMIFVLVIGLAIALPTSLFAATSYMLVKATYPILLSGAKYTLEDLPVLNYQGNTYVPLKAFGEIMDASVEWNEAKRQVEISNYPYMIENNAFRNVTVTGSGGEYTIKGEGRIFEANMNYLVTDGHTVLLDRVMMLKDGAPAWAAFTLEISIPASQQPDVGLLTLQLYESSAKDGSKINRFNVPLEIFR